MQPPVMCAVPYMNNQYFKCSNCNTVKLYIQFKECKCDCSTDSKIAPLEKVHCSNCKIIKNNKDIYDPFCNSYKKCSCGNKEWTPVIN